MIIKSCEIVTSAGKFNQLPPSEFFEVVLIGKSNVGKSSFINNLLNRKALARTSSTPGKTRTANFYLVNNSFYLVDMPGYGYAKVSKSLKVEFDKIIKDYLSKRNSDFIVFFLLDFRHKPTKNDISMYETILSYGITPVIVLTKLDKVNKTARNKNLKVIKEELKLTNGDKFFLYSTVEKRGRDEVLSFIEEVII